MEWDGPEPAVLVGLDEDVVLVGGGQRFRALEVGVDGEVLEEGVPAAGCGLLGQQSGLTGGVDDEAGGQLALSGGVGDVADGGFAVRVRPLDGGDAVALADFDAVGSSVVEQDVVEGGAPDLEGVGILDAGLAEVPAPRLGVAAPDHGGTVLGEEAGGLDGIHRAQLFEDGHGGGQQGLADVVAGEALALQQDDAPALTGQHGGGGAASGAAADDGHVCRGLLGHCGSPWMGLEGQGRVR